MIILILLIAILFYFKFKEKFSQTKKDKVAVISVMYKPKSINVWLDLHRKLGISHFYIRLEDTPELIEYLQSQPDVTLQVGTSDASNQYSSIMDRQLKMANDALALCKKDGMDFLIQIDCDEILEGDLNEIISLPLDVDTFWMQNFEAVYDGIPSSQDICFQAKVYRDCSTSEGGCVAYANGKGGCRVGNTVESNGCHRFKGLLKEVKLNNMIVKHYESCDFEQYLKKYKRYQKGVKLEDIPFPYYRESILAKDDTALLTEIYKKYRTS